MEPAERASEPAGRASEPAWWASEPAGKASEPAANTYFTTSLWKALENGMLQDSLAKFVEKLPRNEYNMDYMANFIEK